MTENKPVGITKNLVLKSLIGQEASRVWLAYGYELYLEFGHVDKNGIGEQTLVLSGVWKLSVGNNLLVRSTAENRSLDEGNIQRLSHLKIRDVLGDKRKVSLVFDSKITIEVSSNASGELLALTNKIEDSWLILSTNGIFTENKTGPSRS